MPSTCTCIGFFKAFIVVANILFMKYKFHSAVKRMIHLYSGFMSRTKVFDYIEFISLHFKGGHSHSTD